MLPTDRFHPVDSTSNLGRFQWQARCNQPPAGACALASTPYLADLQGEGSGHVGPGPGLSQPSNSLSGLPLTACRTPHAQKPGQKVWAASGCSMVTRITDPTTRCRLVGTTARQPAASPFFRHALQRPPGLMWIGCRASRRNELGTVRDD